MRIRLVLVALLGCSRSPAPSVQPAPESGPAHVATGSEPVAAVAGDGQAPSGELPLAGPDEPGKKLRVTGVLVRAEDRTPIPHHRFRIYQADVTGDYKATDPQDERTARLSADVTTDAEGRFAIRTIVPGVYGDPPGDPHLHLEVTDASPPMHVIYFDRFLQEDTKRWAETTEQAHIVAVSETPDGVLSGHLTLPVRGVRASR